MTEGQELSGMEQTQGWEQDLQEELSESQEWSIHPGGSGHLWGFLG